MSETFSLFLLGEYHIYLSFFWVWLSHKFPVIHSESRLLLFSFYHIFPFFLMYYPYRCMDCHSFPSQLLSGTAPLFFVWMSQKYPVPFINYFWIDTQLCFYFFCVWTATHFLSHFFFSELPYIFFDFSVELSYLILCDCHTNFMSLLLKVYSSLLPSKPLIPLSCVDCHIFSSHFIGWKCTILLWVIVTQISCFVSWLFPRIHFTSFILCMDCHTFLLHFLSGHYTCHTSFSYSWWILQVCW